MHWTLPAGLLACFALVSGLGQDAAPAPAQGAPASSSPAARLKVVSWNVLYGFNRSRSTEAAAQWLQEEAPDVVALQELNGVTEEGLQKIARGFGHAHAVIQKEQGFAMGLTSNAPIEVLERRVEGFHHGYLHCKTHGVHFFVVHFWPGKEHEVEVVLAKARTLTDAFAHVVLLGDFNAHSARDAGHIEGKGFEPRFNVLKTIEAAGFVDVVHRFAPHAAYSFPSPITIPEWSKDLDELVLKRQRIDFILPSAFLAAGARAASIEHSDVLDGISDHYPVIAEFALPPGGKELARRDFAFGVIADCQYCANKSAGQRLYSASPSKLRACVDHLNLLHLAYVVHLGDFIDRDFKSFDVVAPIYDSLRCDKYHVLGNHDFTVADEHKEQVPAKLGLTDRYYDFAVDDWRFIVLDGNDISLQANPKESPAYAAAQRYRSEHAPDAPTWNGALGDEQLVWLHAALTRADEAGEKVVIFCHFPVYPENVHNLWNANEVLKIIGPHPSVKAYINGHNHAGNYAVKDGVHYLTMKGMVDTEHTSYAMVEVRSAVLSVLGFGREPDRTLDLR